MEPGGNADKLRDILKRAEDAYAEFERQMRDLDQESRRVFEGELADLDRKRIDMLRKKIAAQRYG
jgi:Sec-independent protein translocase protein TatA